MNNHGKLHSEAREDQSSVVPTRGLIAALVLSQPDAFTAAELGMENGQRTRKNYSEDRAGKALRAGPDQHSADI